MSSQTRPRPIDDAALEAEAYAWLAQMDGENFTDKDLAAFREWANRSPAHAQKIQSLNSFWGELNVLTDMAPHIAKADHVSRTLRKTSHRRSKAVWGGLAACLMLISAVYVGTVFAPQNNMAVTAADITAVTIPTIYKTRIGEHQSYTLPDGSQITLNTNSTVEVEYRTDQRRLRLRQGEALFDVHSDKTRPFLVFADDHIVRAVGTAFSVKLAAKHVDVLVSEGVVELSALVPEPVSQVPSTNAEKVTSLATLKSGYSARLENTTASIKALQAEELVAKLSWTHGLLTFQDNTLEDVIGEVGRYTADEIIISDPELHSLRLGGVFKAGDMDSLISSLETNFDITVDQTVRGRVVLRKS